MEEFTKITRRFFNKFVATIPILGAWYKRKTQDYMDVYIIPEEFRYPYSHKVREVLYNHKISGKTNKDIKEFIMSQSKKIRIPVK